MELKGSTVFVVTIEDAWNHPVGPPVIFGDEDSAKAFIEEQHSKREHRPPKQTRWCECEEITIR